MDKKHISIFGSCVSRHLFNTPMLEETFVVDRYAYQVCPWDAINEGLDIPKEEILKFYKEEFTARMIWYDLCKVSLSEMESVKSEYLMVDLYTIIQNVMKLSLGGKTVYAQVSYDRYSAFLDAGQSDVPWRGLTVEYCKHDSFDRSVFENGIRAFADWINANYDGEKVIVNIPPFAANYFDINNNLSTYSEQTRKTSERLLESVKYYSYLLASCVPGSKVLELYREHSVSQYGIYDDIKRIVPTDVHYTDEDYLHYSELFLKLVGVPYAEAAPGGLSHLGYECMRFRNLYLKARAAGMSSSSATSVEVLRKLETNLNDYVRRLDDLNDFIIVIAAKDEASYSLKKFVEREKLGLDMQLLLRDSYIAVIDKSRNFKYERAAEEMQSYTYSVGNCRFMIESAGYLTGCNASIKRVRNNVVEEFSLNRRGLNIAIFDSKSFELIDSIKCDTHLDVELRVESAYLERAMADIKISTSRR